MMKQIRRNFAFSPQSYMEIVTGNYYCLNSDNDDVTQTKIILKQNGFANLKNYALNELDKAIKRGKDIILVEFYSFSGAREELRWCELPDGITDEQIDNL